MRIGIDPGVHQWAWALGESELLACGLTSDVNFFAGLTRLTGALIEFPRIYPGVPDKRPQDLLDLAGAAGEARQALRTAGVYAKYIFPQDWKGQVKKPISHHRIWRELTLAERERAAAGIGMPAAAIEAKILEACQTLARTGEVKKYSWAAHNVLDGIGIWCCDRRTKHGGTPAISPLHAVRSNTCPPPLQSKRRASKRR